MNHKLSILERLALAVIAIGFTAWSATFIWRSSFVAVDGQRYFCLFDDAMISMRYAWNGAHGLGLVWNAGEYVQGYTNLLMTLVMTCTMLVCNKLQAVVLVQALGIVTMIGVAYSAARLVDWVESGRSDLRGLRLQRIGTFLCVLCYYPLVFWSLMGMEAGLLALFQSVGLLYAFRYSEDGASRSLALATTCFALAFLTRNESLIPAAIVLTFLLARARSSRGGLPMRQLTAAVAAYALVMACEFLFQRVYYGDWLPNTYTLKLTGVPWLARMAGGIGFVRPFLGFSAIVLATAAVRVCLAFSARAVTLFAIVIAGIAYQVWVGGDPWTYWRMMAPSMPLAVLLFLSGAFDLARRATGAGARIPVSIRVGAAVLLIVGGMLGVNARRWDEMAFRVPPPQIKFNVANVNTAVVVNAVTTSRATVGVLMAGALPYYTDRRAIDYLGKCDRLIARLPPDMSGKIAGPGMISAPGHNKYDLEYSIEKLKPTYSQTFRHASQNIEAWARGHYAKVAYSGVGVFLLENSPDVMWDKVTVLTW